MKQVHEKARSQGKIPQDRIGHSFAQIADVCLSVVFMNGEVILTFRFVVIGREESPRRKTRVREMQ